MSAHPRIPLGEAEKIAAEIVEWLRPVTERIEVAGSIRRGIPEVSDIEIVCAPKIQETAIDLFGQATDTRNYLDEHILFSLVHHDEVTERTDKNGRQAIGSRYKRLRFIPESERPAVVNTDYDRVYAPGGEPRGVPLDLFSVIEPAQWGVIFAIRTGPAAFSQRMVTQRSKGGILPDEMWVKDGALWTGAHIFPRDTPDTPDEKRSGSTVHIVEERDFFEAIGLEWIEPEARR